MSDTSKITLSLPSGLVADLDFVASRIGISRSGLVAELLSQSVARMRPAAELLPIAPGREPIRLRGDSVEVVRERVASLGAFDGR